MADGTPSIPMPHNLAAEAAVLGAILFDNAAFKAVSEVLDAEHFYAPAHRHLFEVIAAQIAAGNTADGVTLAEHFEAEGKLKEVGGESYLMDLLDAAAYGPEVRDYAFIIRDLWTRRALIRFGADVQADATLMPMDRNGQAAAIDASTGLESILKSAMIRTRQINMADEIMEGVIGRITETLAAGRALPAGISTGLADLDEQLGKMHAGDLIILAARPGMGKAQPLDSMVLTASGWKPMGSLRLGEALASVDGGPSQVAGIFPQGEKQIYRITFSDGRSAECCGEHLWKVRYRDWDSDRIISTDDLRSMLTRKRYAGRLSIDLFAGDFGAESELPIDPWMLGIIIGDGNLCSGQVRFSSKDAEIIERVASLLPAGLRLSQAGGYDYRISSPPSGGRPNPVKDALKGLGLFGLRSHEKFIPRAYLEASRSQRWELLRGLMDSDGWAEKFGAIRLTTSSARLADDICTLVRSLGGVCSVKERSVTYTYKGERKAGRNGFTCRIRFENGYEAFSLKRKAERAVRKSGTVRLTIRSIEASRVADAQCISVSHPSRLYITDEFVVTHNTALALHLAHRSLRRDADGFEHPARCAFFSLEMDDDPLAHRVMSMAARMHRMGVIPYRNIRKGRIGQSEAATLKAAVAKLPKSVAWHTTGDLTLDEITAGCRQASRKLGGLDLVIIDYLQLIRFEVGRGENTASAVGRITKGLKALAKELAVPIVCLSQLSREVEHRDNKRPQLSDLRDSGAIEQDADAVIFVYRDEYYLAKEEPKGGPSTTNTKWHEWQDELQSAKGVVELIAAKVRQGRPGTIKVHMELETNTVVADKRELQEERML